jgi:hypothetical protein
MIKLGKMRTGVNRGRQGNAAEWGRHTVAGWENYSVFEWQQNMHDFMSRAGAALGAEVDNMILNVMLGKA